MKPITDKQVTYLSKLREERGLSNDGIASLTAREASEEIDRLQATPKAQVLPGGTVVTPNSVITPSGNVVRAADARTEDADLIGKRFHVSVADSGAIYEVVSDFGGFVTVRLVDGGPDNRRDAVLGDECTVSRANIARLVGGER